jgi:hypothetical protein
VNKASRNEGRKLTATFINGLAIAVFAIGGVTQILGIVQTAQFSIQTVLLIAGCAFMGAALHWSGRFILGGMEESSTIVF